MLEVDSTSNMPVLSKVTRNSRIAQMLMFQVPNDNFLTSFENKREKEEEKNILDENYQVVLD